MQAKSESFTSDTGPYFPPLPPALHSDFTNYVTCGVEPDLLWIIASHIDVPRGKFAQSHIFEHLHGNKLFLNVAENSWYQQGISADCDSIEALVHELVGFGKQFRRVRAVGHSMGAYLALALQHTGHVEAAIVSSPEPRLLIPHSRSHINAVQPQAGWQNLTKRFSGKSNCAAGLTLFGAYDPIDAYYLAHLEDDMDLYRRVLAVPHHHGVTEYLTGNRVYLQVLKDVREGADLLVEKKLAGLPREFGTRGHFITFYELYVALAENSDDARILRLVKRRAKWSNAGWRTLTAKAFMKLGQPDKAAEILLDIIQPKMTYLEPLSVYVELIKKSNNRNDLIDLADKIKSLDLHPRVTQNLLGRLNLAPSARPL